MADAVHHAPRLGGVLDLDRVPDAAQAERAKRVDLVLLGAVLGLDLRHLHDEASSWDSDSASDGAASAAGSSGTPLALIVSAAALRALRPSTVSIDRPRSSATSCGVRSD